MKLYIVRHGIAIDRDDPKCPPDPERYLTEEGVEKTLQAAKGAAGLGVAAGLFFASPHVRAAQTAENFPGPVDYPKQGIRPADFFLPRGGASPLFPGTLEQNQA